MKILSYEQHFRNKFEENILKPWFKVFGDEFYYNKLKYYIYFVNHFNYNYKYVDDYFNIFNKKQIKLDYKTYVVIIEKNICYNISFIKIELDENNKAS